MAGGLEQGGWVLERVSKGLGGWGLERAEGLGPGGGLDPQGTGTLGRTFARTDGRSFGRTENSPLCPIGHRPLRVRCPKGGKTGSARERGGESEREANDAGAKNMESGWERNRA